MINGATAKLGDPPPLSTSTQCVKMSTKATAITNPQHLEHISYLPAGHGKGPGLPAWHKVENPVHNLYHIEAEKKDRAEVKIFTDRSGFQNMIGAAAVFEDVKCAHCDMG